MSTSPLVPKPEAGSPVSALSATSFFRLVKMIRGDVFASPGQYVTPRNEARPSFNSCVQISLPVSGSSATTRPPTGMYMTPFTTMGVTSWKTSVALGVRVDASGVSGGSRNDHDLVNFETFVVLIWANGE